MIRQASWIRSSERSPATLLELAGAVSQINVRELITEKQPLDRINEGFTLVDHGARFRGVVVH
jgi:Zn-dependent alcohol dehydrogenase